SECWDPLPCEAPSAAAGCASRTILGHLRRSFCPQQVLAKALEYRVEDLNFSRGWQVQVDGVGQAKASVAHEQAAPRVRLTFPLAARWWRRSFLPTRRRGSAIP